MFKALLTQGRVASCTRVRGQGPALLKVLRNRRVSLCRVLNKYQYRGHFETTGGSLLPFCRIFERVHLLPRGRSARWHISQLAHRYNILHRYCPLTLLDCLTERPALVPASLPTAWGFTHSSSFGLCKDFFSCASLARPTTRLSVAGTGCSTRRGDMFLEHQNGPGLRKKGLARSYLRAGP